MIQYNTISVIPFYTDINEQNHRRSYAYGDIYPLFVPAGQMLPFQLLTISVQGHHFGYLHLMNLKGEMVLDLSRQVEEGGLRITQFPDDGYDIIMYPGIMPLALDVQEGRYYMELASTAGVFYSEVITIVGDIKPFLKVEWCMLHDLISYGWRIQYDNGEYQFKNIVYLNTQLGKPDYEFEETGESRDGWFFPEKMISEKTYKFQFLASEFLCDVMRFVRMADEAQVTDRYGRTYRCDQFVMDVKWQDQGNLASVNAEFQTDTVAKSIGRGLPPADLGAFNDDYNNDYDITNTNN